MTHDFLISLEYKILSKQLNHLERNKLHNGLILPYYFLVIIFNRLPFIHTTQHPAIKNDTLLSISIRFFQFSFKLIKETPSISPLNFLII